MYRIFPENFFALRNESLRTLFFVDCVEPVAVAMLRSEAKSLYRQLLVALRTFTSRKRDALIADVKLEFREAAKSEADAARRVALARDSLHRVLSYGRDDAVSLAGPRTVSGPTPFSGGAGKES